MAGGWSTPVLAMLFVSVAASTSVAPRARGWTSTSPNTVVPETTLVDHGHSCPVDYPESVHDGHALICFTVSGTKPLRLLQIEPGTKKIGNHAFDPVLGDWSRKDADGKIKPGGSPIFADGAIIPSTVESIGDYAFAGYPLSSVAIGKSVRSIGEAAFKDTKLTKIFLELPALRSIGSEAFSGSKLAGKITVPCVCTVGESAFPAGVKMQRPCSEAERKLKVQINQLKKKSVDLAEELKREKEKADVEYGQYMLLRAKKIQLGKWWSLVPPAKQAVIKARGFMRPGETVALWNPVHKRYMRMNGDKMDVSAVSSYGQLPSHWTWEQFKVVDAGNGQIALHNAVSNRFVKMSGYVMMTSPTTDADQLPSNWPSERFRLVDVGGGVIALHNELSNRFVRMNAHNQMDGSHEKKWNELPPLWTWEQFQVVRGTLTPGCVRC